MGQVRVPAALEAGQQWNAVLSIEPFSAWTIPGEAQGKSFAEEGWERIEPSGCWLEAALQAWRRRNVEHHPCSPAGSMDTEGKDAFRATLCLRQLFGARTYPQGFRDWCLHRGSSARPCTKCLRYGRRKRPTQTYTHDAGGEEGALWVLLLKLCTPPSLCLSVHRHTRGAPPASIRSQSHPGGGLVHSLELARGQERERSHHSHPTLTCPHTSAADSPPWWSQHLQAALGQWRQCTK